MAEYIKRRDALKVLEEMESIEDGFARMYELPAADVVEVVRCGECKSWCPISNGKAGTCKGKVQGVTKPDDFCSRGERRDNNAAD